MEIMAAPTINPDIKEIILKNKEEINISPNINLSISYNESIISFKIID